MIEIVIVRVKAELKVKASCAVKYQYQQHVTRNTPYDSNIIIRANTYVK